MSSLARPARVPGRPGWRSLVVLLAGCAAGCSGDAWKRTTYETLQNVNQQQCEATPGADCERQSYEDYQRMRDKAGETR
jgi:hypothetical protein